MTPVKPMSDRIAIGVWCLYYVALLVGAFVLWTSWLCLGVALLIVLMLGFYWHAERER